MLKLHRFLSTSQHTMGVLIYDQKVVCCTLELPWRQNQRNISRIPVGLYPLSKITSKKFGNCIAVHNVPGRSGILFHAGNTVKDTRGCILTGLHHINNGIFASRVSLTNLLNTLPDNEPINLFVKDAY